MKTNDTLLWVTYFLTKQAQKTTVWLRYPTNQVQIHVFTITDLDRFEIKNFSVYSVNPPWI